ncbi:MAG TPA: L-seryl-tRNA(Sec) selenium transferase [Actinomycetota bacterium]|nr:L-seryl-tRNA(Sec) selenium transferase [Actinomycetota bacterium]
MAGSGSEPRRRIPSVDALLRSEPGKRASATFGRALLKRALTEILVEVRGNVGGRRQPPSDDVILARAAATASRAANGLTPVINATGVVLHTGLGRAPLPAVAVRAVVRTATGYSDLEIDRETGARGRRTARAELLLRALTGAEDALVVNNGAAGLLVSLASLAKGKQVLVSRGELIEIGGEFRIPDIMAASGARLVEVGTTNRTRISDYRAALTDRTALILKVHPSNYRIVGFTTAPGAKEIGALATRAGLPFVYDLGSGLLEPTAGVPDDEPSAARALADGADLAIFSGDKLLGGPQAGIVLGRAKLVERLRRHPIARAVRVDKMQAAALETVLAEIAAGRADELPVRRMLREPVDHVRRRAERLSLALDGELEGAHVIACESSVGGGSLPGHPIRSFGVEVRVPDPNAMAARLRTGVPSVFCRVTDAGVLFDLRTVGSDELPDLTRAVQYALEGDDVADA